MPIVWPIPPNLDSALVERLDWLTDVLPSHNVTEERIRLRGNPRRRLRFDALAADDNARTTIYNLLAATDRGGVILPFWPDRQALASDLPAGSTGLSLDTSGRAYQVDESLVLTDGRHAEAVTVASVTPTALTFSATARDWSAGCWVVPGSPARLSASINLTSPIESAADLTIDSLYDAGVPLVATSDTADYLGLPLLVPPSNWQRVESSVFRRDFDTFDPIVGLRAEYDYSGVSYLDPAFVVALDGIAAIDAHRGWLAARAGQLNPVWLASGLADLEPMQAIGSTDPAIVVAHTGYSSFATPPAGRRDVLIETTAGTRIVRRITAAAEIDAASESLTLSATTGVALALTDIAHISFVQLVRLAADAVEIAHGPGEVAESRLNFRGVREAA